METAKNRTALCQLASAALLCTYLAQGTAHATTSGSALTSTARRADFKRKQWSAGLELGDSRLRLDTARAKLARPSDPWAAIGDRRLASWSLSASYERDLGSIGSIGLAGEALGERRRPAGLLSGGRALNSGALFAGLSWTDGKRTALAIGPMMSGISGSRHGFDRLMELAAGAPLNAHGLRLAGTLGDTTRGTSLGFDARLQQVGASDALLVSGRPRTRDARMSISLRTYF